MITVSTYFESGSSGLGQINTVAMGDIGFPVTFNIGTNYAFQLPPLRHGN